MRRTLKEIGREKLAQDKTTNVAAASGFRVGEQVQYYKDGWRCGYVLEIGVKLRAGLILIEQAVTKKEVLVKASDCRELPARKAMRKAKGRKAPRR